VPSDVASIHAGMACDGMICLGVEGLRFPAVTTSPWLNFSRAKLLASPSLANVLVDRGLRLLGKAPRRSTSKVTYQVCATRHPRGWLRLWMHELRRFAPMDPARKSRLDEPGGERAAWQGTQRTGITGSCT
jgi:hypothetical protein